MGTISIEPEYSQIRYKHHVVRSIIQPNYVWFKIWDYPFIPHILSNFREYYYIKDNGVWINISDSHKTQEADAFMNDIMYMLNFMGK